MDKSTEKARDFIHAWKLGWPEYIYFPDEDNRPIIEIAEKCSKIAGVSLEEEEGFRRVLSGLASIAAYCRDHDGFKTKKMAYIAASLQNILLHMNADKRARQEAANKQEEVKRMYEGKRNEFGEGSRGWYESSLRSAEWAIANWDYIWENSKRLYYNSGQKIAMSYEQSKENAKMLTEDETEQIKKDVEEMKDRWRKRANELRKLIGEK